MTRDLTGCQKDMLGVQGIKKGKRRTTKNNGFQTWEPWEVNSNISLEHQITNKPQQSEYYK